MKLGEWLTSKGKTNADFATMLGVDESSVSRYVNGRMPRKPILVRIMSITENQVTANDFVDDEAAPDESSGGVRSVPSAA